MARNIEAGSEPEAPGGGGGNGGVGNGGVGNGGVGNGGARNGGVGDYPAVVADEAPRPQINSKWKAYSVDFGACMTSARGFLEASANCYNAELARQSTRLNQAYGTAIATRVGSRKDALIEAQRAWTKLRDSSCRGASGREGEILREGSCRLDMTIRRADELERLAG